MNKIIITEGHVQAEQAYQDSLKREAALLEDLDILHQRLTTAEKLLKRVHQADALAHCCPLWKAIDVALKPELRTPNAKTLLIGK